MIPTSILTAATPRSATARPINLNATATYLSLLSIFTGPPQLSFFSHGQWKVRLRTVRFSWTTSETSHLQLVSLYGYLLIKQAVRGTAHPVRLVGRVVHVAPRVATRSLQVT